jgi:prevent-host-death family protein
MKSVGIRELKAHLSSVLARVRRGETIAVTDRRRRGAMLVPADDADPRALARAPRCHVADWLVRGKPKGLRAAPEVRGPSVADAVIEDRR